MRTSKETEAVTDAVAPPKTSRPVVHSNRGVVSSGHYLTSMAGLRMLLSGGNAFDAVVASCFAAAVVEPVASYSLGAEAVFMLYDAESGDLLSLSGQGVAPRKATVEFFKDQGLDEIPTGPGPLAHLSFTVPGVVEALLSMLERYGTKRLADVLEPSIEYARQGMPHYEYMLKALDSTVTREQFALYPPGGLDVFYDDGAVPKPGSLLVQPGLANTFEHMVAAESAASPGRAAGLRAAREAFHSGDIASSIVGSAQRVGGVMEIADLSGYHAKYEDPLRIMFAGHEICGQPTWTQGAVLLQALNILESFDLAAMGHNSPAYVHTVVEALKLCLADRQAYYGDPEFAEVPIDGLLSKDYAAARAQLIDAGHAVPELPAPGDPLRHSGGPARLGNSALQVSGGDEDGRPEEHGTTHVAALDNLGNMVCATPSGGAFAKSVFFPELGFALSTRSEMFNFEEGHPNVLEPGKRPRTTLVNYFVLKDGVPVMTIGCPGGDYQAQANLQLALNTLVFGMNPQEAIEAPRFASDSVPRSFYPHEYRPGQLSMESGFGTDTEDSLRELGHNVVRASVCGMGATVTRRDPDNGVMSAGADPRRAAYAIGW